MTPALIDEAFLAVMNARDRQLGLPLSDWAGRNLLKRRIGVALQPLCGDTMRLREAICRIALAREQGDFDAMMTAIDDAMSEATLSALRAAGER